MIMLIAGIVVLILAFVVIVASVAEKEFVFGLMGVLLTVVAIGLIYVGGFGNTRSLDRSFTTNIKVISACTNNESVIIVGILPNNSVRVFDFPTGKDNVVKVGFYHHITSGDRVMKIMPFDQND